MRGGPVTRDDCGRANTFLMCLVNYLLYAMRKYYLCRVCLSESFQQPWDIDGVGGLLTNVCELPRRI